MNEPKYLFEISTDTSLFTVISNDYKGAINVIEREINIPKEFVSNYYLEKVTTLSLQHLKHKEELRGQKNVND